MIHNHNHLNILTSDYNWKPRNSPFGDGEKSKSQF